MLGRAGIESPLRLTKALTPAPSTGGWGGVLGGVVSLLPPLCSVCQELKLLHCSSLAKEGDSLLSCGFWPRA